jgi:hypothetical protein
LAEEAAALCVKVTAAPIFLYICLPIKHPLVKYTKQKKEMRLHFSPGLSHVGAQPGQTQQAQKLQQQVLQHLKQTRSTKKDMW